MTHNTFTRLTPFTQRMSLRLMHAVVHASSSLFLIAERGSAVRTHCNLFIQAPVDRHLGRSEFRVITSKVAVTICGSVLCRHVFLFLMGKCLLVEWLV